MEETHYRAKKMRPVGKRRAAALAAVLALLLGIAALSSLLAREARFLPSFRPALTSAEQAEKNAAQVRPVPHQAISFQSFFASLYHKLAFINRIILHFPARGKFSLKSALFLQRHLVKFSIFTKFRRSFPPLRRRRNTRCTVRQGKAAYFLISFFTVSFSRSFCS